MIDVKSVTDMQHETVTLWHEQPVTNTYDGILGTACTQHSFNYLLWHEEDVARSREIGDARVAEAKRAIDGYNQQRNDWIERLDAAIAEKLETDGIEPGAQTPLNTETPGSAMDRLSILSLRMYHLEEQLERDDVGAEHLDSVRRKIAICRIQHHELSRSLGELLADIFAGRKRHRTYHQMKMYNDPSLNPYLYQAHRKAV